MCALKESLFYDEESDDSDKFDSRSISSSINCKKQCPLLYYFLCDSVLFSASIFRFMVLKGLLTGRGVMGDMFTGSAVKYFVDKKVGSRSELHYIKRKDTKKSCGVLRSKFMERVLEKQLESTKKNDTSEFNFELFVQFQEASRST
uniref:Uncharacterized protein n=2 Tax=Corethron hystrix TaxID=216773 RepID=A0A7S1FSX3_9STRA|mmetsp:Transcript_25101/g.58014  ORF Transcript_25101/g.58014 Transcript_25101/m.58014 type:complete len:146 (+) Transcript_25101:1642-2079(+)